MPNKCPQRICDGVRTSQIKDNKITKKYSMLNSKCKVYFTLYTPTLTVDTVSNYSSYCVQMVDKEGKKTESVLGFVSTRLLYLYWWNEPKILKGISSFGDLMIVVESAVTNIL